MSTSDDNQLALDFLPRTWGGARSGAGRKRAKVRRDPLHRERPDHVDRFPLHVVMRVRPDIGRLRRGVVYRAVRRAMRSSGRAGFRICHLSIQHNHLHLLVEAETKLILSRGMQGFTISAARAINAALGRTGKVFAFRYHATELKSPRQTRNALAYVLNNWRHHREDERSGSRARVACVDPYSSGISFHGWRGIASFAMPEDYEPLPVASAQTWLLRVGWLVHGELDPYAVPGALH